MGDNLRHFSIERVRTRRCWYLLAILTGTLIGYGWALEERSHVSIPLLLQSIQGFLGTSIYTIFNTLLVDLFSESPGTAAAAASISCALAASGVAVVQPLVGVLGRGWYFTALAVVTGSLGFGGGMDITEVGREVEAREGSKDYQSEYERRRWRDRSGGTGWTIWRDEREEAVEGCGRCCDDYLIMTMLTPYLRRTLHLWCETDLHCCKRSEKRRRGCPRLIRRANRPKDENTMQNVGIHPS